MRRFIGWLLLIAGLVCVIFAGVYQMILEYQMFGFIISGEAVDIFIPHWSAWFFLGIIPVGFGYLLIHY